MVKNKNQEEGTTGAGLTAEDLYKLESSLSQGEEKDTDGSEDESNNNQVEKTSKQNDQVVPGTFSEKEIAAIEGSPYKTPSIGVTGPTSQAIESDYTNAHILGTDARSEAAYNQDFLDEMGNLAANAIAGEVVGGTIEMVGNLVDFEDAHDLWTQNGEEIDRNFLSQLGSDIRKGTRENFRTYADYDRNKVTGKNEPVFAPLDSSWWAEKGPSMASTLTTLIPSFAAVKALKGLGRISKLTTKLDDFVRAKKGEGFARNLATGAEGVTQGILSRHMESMLESTRAFEEIKEEAISNGVSEEEAIRTASEEAAKQYRQNSALAITDVAQFLKINRMPKLARMHRASKIPKSVQKVGEGVKDAALEGAEEAWQFVTAEEAKYRAGRRLGTEEYTDFEARMSKYLGDAQFQTEALMGSLGGLAFQGIGKAMKKGVDKLSGRAEQMIEKDAGKQAIQDLNHLNKRLQELENSNDEEGAEYTRGTVNADIAFKHAENGTLDKWRQTVESLKNTNAGNWNEQNPNAPISEDPINRADEFIQQIDRIEQIWDETAREFKGNEQRIPDIARRTYEIERLDNYINQKNKEIQESFNNYPGKQDLTDKGKQIFDQEMEIKSLEQNKESLQYQIDNNLLKDKKKAQEAIDYSDKLIESAKKEIEGIKEGDTRTDQQVQADNEIIKDAKKNASELPTKMQKVKMARFYRNLNSKELAEFKNVKKKSSDIEKNIKNRRQTLQYIADNTNPAPNEEITEGDIVELGDTKDLYTYKGIEKTSTGKTEHVLQSYENPDSNRLKLSDDQFNNQAVKRKPINAESQKQQENRNTQSYQTDDEGNIIGGKAETLGSTEQPAQPKTDEDGDVIEGKTETLGKTEQPDRSGTDEEGNVILGKEGSIDPDQGSSAQQNEDKVEVGDLVTLNTPKGGEGIVTEDRGDKVLVQKEDGTSVQPKKENVTIDQKSGTTPENPQENRQSAQKGVEAYRGSLGQPETTDPDLSNSEEQEIINSQRKRSLDQIMHLAWRSSENSKFPEDEEGENLARSRLLEDPDFSLYDKQLKLTVNRDLSEEIMDKTVTLADGNTTTVRNIINKHDNNQELTEAEAGKLPIKVEMLDPDTDNVIRFNQDGVATSDGEYSVIGALHDDDYYNIDKEVAEDEYKLIRENKKQIADNERAGYTSITNVVDMTGGFPDFITDQEVENPKDKYRRPSIAMAGNRYADPNEVELAILNTDFAYYSGRDQPSKVLEDRGNTNKQSVGAVFIGVRDAANEGYPVRTFVDNIDDKLGNIIYESYNRLINDSKASDQISDKVRQLINEETDSDLVIALRKMLDMDENPDAEVTYQQLLSNSIYQGKNQTFGLNNELYFEDGKVYTYNTSLKRNSEDEAGVTTAQFGNMRNEFIDYLKNNKKFQVNLDRLNETKYKQALYDHVLKTDVNPEAERLFQQPRIRLNDNIQKKGQGTAKEAGATSYPDDTTAPSVSEQETLEIKKSEIEKQRQQELDNAFDKWDKEYVKNNPDHSLSIIQRLDVWENTKAGEPAKVKEINEKYDKKLRELEQQTTTQETQQQQEGQVQEGEQGKDSESPKIVEYVKEVKEVFWPSLSLRVDRSVSEELSEYKVVEGYEVEEHFLFKLENKNDKNIIYGVLSELEDFNEVDKSHFEEVSKDANKADLEKAQKTFDNYLEIADDDIADQIKTFVENKKLEEKQEPDQPDNTKQDPRDFFNNPDNRGAGDTNNDDFFDFRMDKTNGNYNVENIEAMRSWLKDKLNIEPEVVNGLIKVNEKGERAFGAFRDGMITLSNLAEQGTAYHEAFHAVSRTYLNDQERNDLYDEASYEYGIDRNNEREIEERLAEDFRLYQSRPQDLTLSENVRKLFQALKRIIQSVINKPLTRDKVFNRISKGYYAGQQGLTVSNVNVGDETFYRRVEGFTEEETQEWGKTLGFLAIRRSIVDNKRQKLEHYNAWGDTVKDDHPRSLKNLAIQLPDENGNMVKRYPKDEKELSSAVNETLDYEDVGQPDFSLVKDAVFSYGRMFTNNGDIELGKKYMQVYQNFGEFTPVANQVLEDLGVIAAGDTQRRILKEEDESADEDQKTDWENLKPTFEVSDRANMTNTVKMLVAMVPKKRINDKGEVVTEKSPYTGLPTFNDFPATWKYLNKKLADIVPTEDSTTGEMTDPVDTMIERMKSLIGTKPELDFIVKKLQEWDSNKRSQFYKSIQGTMRDFLFTTLSETSEQSKKERRRIVKIGSATQDRIVGQLRKQWAENFKYKLVKNNNEINVDKARAATAKFEKQKTGIVDQVLNNIKKKDTAKHEELIERLQNILSDVGIDMSYPGIREAIYQRNADDKYQGFKELVTDLSNVFSMRKTGRRDTTLKSMTEYEDNRSVYDEQGNLRSPITDEKIVRELAEIESNHTGNLSEFNVLDPKGRQNYPFSEHNYMTSIIAEMKSKDDPAIIKERLQDPYNTNSRWINWLQDKENRDKFDHHNHLSVREENRGDQGAKYEDTNTPDDLTDRFNKLLKKGYYPELTPAEKPTFYYFSGPPLVTDPNEAVTQFAKYLFDEYMRVRKAYDDLYGENALTDDQLIENYHYKGENNDGSLNRDNANALKHQLFPEMNDGGTLFEEVDSVVRDKENNNRPVIPDADFINNETIRNHIDQRIKNIVTNTTEYAVENGLVERNEKNNNIVNKNIDDNLFNDYLKDNDNNPHKAARKAIIDFAINSTIANIEQIKLFTGDLAHYKSISDFSKRTVGMAAPGQGLRIYKDDEGEQAVRPNFNVAVTEGIEVDSISDQIKQSLIESGLSEDAASKAAEPFSETDQTDAQAWITVDRWAEIMKGLGEWTDELQDSLDDIRKGNSLPSPVSMQSIKGQYFGLSAESYGTNVPTYLKYSQAVLFPGLTKGTQLDELRKAMENNKDENGNPDPIDEVVVDNGIKAGIRKKTKIDDSEGNLLNQDQIDLKPFKLSNKYWKRQNQMGHKGIHEVKEGSQLKAVIMGDINPQGDFYVDEEGNKKGEEVLQAIDQSEIAMSDNETHLFESEFMTTDSTTTGNQQFITNFSKFREIIADAIGQGNAPKEVFDSLKKNIPVETLATHRRQIENKLASMINNTGARTTGSGAGLIQVSNFGMQPKKSQELSDKERGRITWIKEEDKLKAPRIEQDENGNSTVKPGQFLMPHPALEQLKNMKGMENLSEQELVDRLKSDPKLLETINYRIPTQGLPTIDAGEIVGILPPESGDVIVAYTDITTKTGSDFDIDKMSVMVPHYGINKNGEVYTLPFMTDDNSTVKERFDAKLDEVKNSKAGKDLLRSLNDRTFEEAAIEEGLIPDMETFGNLPIEQQNTTKQLYNRKINLYKSILLNKNKYKDLMDPLEELPHMDIAEDIAKKKGYEEGYQSVLTDIEQFTPVQQLREKSKFTAAGAGVGQAANQYKDHINSQRVDIKNLDVLGDVANNEGGKINLSAQKTKNGELISKILYGFISGYVDIANEPWPSFANANTFTNPVIFYMARSGVDLEFIMKFMSQPAIEEAARQSFYEQSRVSDTTFSNGVPQDAIDIVLNRIYSKLDKNTREELMPTSSVFSYVYPETGYQGRSIVGEIGGVAELDENLASGIDNAPNLKNQYEYLKMFKDLVGEASFLTDAVQASRMDVKGYGKDLVEAITTKNIKEKVEGYERGIQTGDDNPRLEGFGAKISNTMLDAHYRNTVQFALNNFRGIFMSANSDVQAVMDAISAETGKGAELTNSDLGSNVRDNLYAFINSEFDNFQLDRDNMKRLFRDTENTKSPATKLTEIKQEDNEISDMALIKMLKATSDQNGNKFVTISSEQSLDPVTEQALRDDWSDLLVHERQDIRDFADDLVKHAFYTSGFMKNLNSFHNLIPLSYFTNDNYADFVSENIVNAEQTRLEGFREYFYKNNASNSSIVPRVGKNLIKAVPKDDKVTYPVKEIFKIDKKAGKGKVEFNTGSDNTQVPYVNYRGGLYSFAGNDADGNFIYMRTNQLGYRKGRQNVKEYRAHRPNGHKVSIFEDNNVEISEDVKQYVRNLPFPVLTGNHNAKIGSTSQKEYMETSEDLMNKFKEASSRKDIVDFYAELTKEQQDVMPQLANLLEQYDNSDVDMTPAKFIQNMIDRYFC